MAVHKPSIGAPLASVLLLVRCLKKTRVFVVSADSDDDDDDDYRDDVDDGATIVRANA